MPPRRQLPWARKDARSTTSNRKTTTKRTDPSDIDDDFFDGTILESSRRSKRRPISDDELSDLPSQHGKSSRRSRESSLMPSSSPPPITADLPPPTTEYMLTGVDKFDLRDDEWMMVEDELLQTAKLFTQHLHLAEYETLKAKIEEQKKIATPRPVVANTKPSTEAYFKAKAQEQEKRQKRALKKVLSARSKSSEEDEPLPSSPPIPPRINFRKTDPSLTTPKLAKPTRSIREPSSIPTRNTSASDSDDLDAAREPIKTEPDLPTKAPASPLPSVSNNRHYNFKKPAIPTQTRKTARSQRRNLWDEWDAMDLKTTSTTFKPSHSTGSQLTKSPTMGSGSAIVRRSSSPAKPISAHTSHGSPKSIKHSRNNTVNSADIGTSARNSLPNGTPDGSGKRKADEQQGSKKKPKYDDIPTFLF